MKRIESACLVQTMIFDSREEFELFKKQLEKKRIPYQVDDVEVRSEGGVCVQMRRRYVHYPVGDYIAAEEER